MIAGKYVLGGVFRTEDLKSPASFRAKAEFHSVSMVQDGPIPGEETPIKNSRSKQVFPILYQVLKINMLWILKIYLKLYAGVKNLVRLSL